MADWERDGGEWGKTVQGTFLTGPGMHGSTKLAAGWSRSSAERLLPVRAAIMSGRFEELWQKAYHPPPN